MKTYAIQWKCTVSGKIRTGTNVFEKKEAERLARELNEEYPNIKHEAVIRLTVEPIEDAAAEP